MHGALLGFGTGVRLPSAAFGDSFVLCRHRGGAGIAVCGVVLGAGLVAFLAEAGCLDGSFQGGHGFPHVGDGDVVVLVHGRPFG